MVVPTEAQNVTSPRKPPKDVDFSIDIAGEIGAVAEHMKLPYNAVRQVIVDFGEDVLSRKVKGSVAKIYAAHVRGLLPSQRAPKPVEAPAGGAA